MVKIDSPDAWFPRRWQMVCMLVSGVAIAYTLRVNISVAAVRMESSLGWDETFKGLVFSSFYVGYAMGQIPSAFMTHWYGAKYLFGYSILLGSFFTLLFPVIIKYSFVAGLFWRVLTGLAASATFPSLYYFYKSWIPLQEKTVMVSAIMSGVYLGEIICFSVSGVLVDTPFVFFGYDIGGWPSCFWFFAVIGFLWYPLWMAYGYETPEDHPYMNPKELAFIRKGQQYNPVAAFDREQEEEEQNRLLEETETKGGNYGPDKYSDPVLVSPESSLMPRVPLNDLTSGGTRLRRNTGDAAESGGPRRLDNSAFASADYSDNEDGDVQAQLSRSLLKNSEQDRDRTDSVACSLISDTEENLKDVARRIPWGHFIRDPVSLTLLFAYFTMSFIGFMVLSEIPSFLTAQLDFELEEAGFVSIAPFIAQLISALGFGQVFGYMQRERGWTISNVRQTAQFICFAGSASCLVICGYMTEVSAAVAFLVLALFFFGATQSGLACSFLDVSPNYSCSLNSLANFVGAIAGIMGPLIVSLFTYIWPGSFGWQAVFIFTAFLCVIALYFWRKYRPCDVVPCLNSPRPKKSVNYKECFPHFRV